MRYVLVGNDWKGSIFGAMVIRFSIEGVGLKRSLVDGRRRTTFLGEQFVCFMSAVTK